METEEDRRSKLENDAPTKQLRLAMETEEVKKARLEKMVATKQIRLRLAMETEEERRAKKRNGFDLYLISKTYIFHGMSSLAL